MFISVVLLHTAAFAQAVEYQAFLLQKARRLNLSEHRYWHLLLHYRPHAHDQESTVNTPLFFLSKTGKTNPAAELEATLKAFFIQAADADESAQCRFVARYAWLKTRLQIDESRLPPVTCADFDRMISAVQPESAVLVFPAADINNPASLFGHTFLRIDAKNQSSLLSTVINYAALTTETAGISYALKGIFGQFSGQYYSLPYYEKIREYSTTEHRDIWEYRLNLSKEEIRRILLHIWEMRDMHSPYYFFDENCTFAVLYLLEIARPSLRLIENTHPFWVLPISSIQSVIHANLVTQVQYRPSLATNIQNASENLSQENRRMAYGLAIGQTSLQQLSKSVLPEEKQIEILDLSSEYLQYAASRRMIQKDAYLDRFQSIMKERSLHQTPSDQSRIKTPASPDQGHRPGRVDLGAGCRTGSCFSEIGLRPLYHDFLDDDNGYILNTQMNFFHLIFRHDFDKKGLKLEKFRVIDMVSLAPRSLFFKPLAWKFKIGYERKRLPNAQEEPVITTTFGAGFSMSYQKILFYALADAEIDISHTFNNHIAFGAGVSIGILSSIKPWWKMHGVVHTMQPVLGDRYQILQSTFTHSFTVNKRNRLSIILWKEKSKRTVLSEVKILWKMYF